MLNVKFALRTLFKTPFVTIVAIVSLALGIGANAAIFSLFDQLLLQPLTVPQPERLVNLAAFTGIAAHVSFGANLAARGQTENGEGLLVSGSYFAVLGLQPALGRLLTPDDDRTPGESHVVVLGHAYWRRRFVEDPAVLGQPLIVNGQTMTIVGVAPRASTARGSA
jgi:hypothetical protein